jgi:hypothetical protein
MEKKGYCCSKMKKFDLENMTYINQIFGDETVRGLIRELYEPHAAKYEFVVEPGEGEFEGSFHHVLKDKTTDEIICSVENGFQDMRVNKNDSLCQSYSLLTFFGKEIDPDQKQKQMDMIKMYRDLLKNHVFITKFKDEILIEKNNKLWKNYTVSHKYNEDLIEYEKENKQYEKAMEKYKSKMASYKLSKQESEISNIATSKTSLKSKKPIEKPEKPDIKQPKKPKLPKGIYLNVTKKSVIIYEINRILDDWESFGYQFFIGDGSCNPKCLESSAGGTKKQTKTKKKKYGPTKTQRRK